VAGTDPSGRAAKGSVVVVQISGGPAANPSQGTGGGGGGGNERCKRLPFLCPSPPRD
jgi:hypothetical protein